MICNHLIVVFESFANNKSFYIFVIIIFKESVCQISVLLIMLTCVLFYLVLISRIFLLVHYQGWSVSLKLNVF